MRIVILIGVLFAAAVLVGAVEGARGASRRSKVVKGRWRVGTTAQPDLVVVYAHDASRGYGRKNFEWAGGSVFSEYAYEAPAAAKIAVGSTAELDKAVRKCQEWCNEKNRKEALAKAMQKRAERQAKVARRRAHKLVADEADEVEDGFFARIGRRFRR